MDSRLNKMANLDTMQTSAIAVVGLAAITLTGIAVVNGFKDTSLIDNATATLFVTGLTIFATFTGVIVLAIVGKLIVGLFQRT